MTFTWTDNSTFNFNNWDYNDKPTIFANYTDFIYEYRCGAIWHVRAKMYFTECDDTSKDVLCQRKPKTPEETHLDSYKNKERKFI